MKTLTRNWRDHKRDRHTQTHGNWNEIFRLARPSFSIKRRRLCRVFTNIYSLSIEKGVFTNIYSLSIEKDGRASRNISFQFPYVCVCLSLLWSLQFLLRVFTFPFLNLWFSYFSTFLSTWSDLSLCYKWKCTVRKAGDPYLNHGPGKNFSLKINNV